MFSVRLTALLLMITLAQEVAGQTGLHFKTLGLNEGLSQNTINTICQDHRGFMWFGTFDGLNRFDGYAFKVYRTIPGDSSSLRSNGIFTLFRDSHNAIWVGTLGGGLHLYDDDRDAFRWIDLGIGKNVIRCILEEPSGVLWIGTNEGIVLLDPKRMKVLRRFIHNPGDPGSLGSNTVNHMVRDAKGRIWIATENNGLDVYNQNLGQFRHYTHTGFSPFSLQDNNLTQLYADPDGSLWIGTRLKGLLHFFPDKEAFFPVSFNDNVVSDSSLPHNFVTCLLPQGMEDLWVGTLGGGLSLMNRNDLKFKHNRRIEDDVSSLSKNAVKTLFIDRDRNIWVGTEGGGINFFDHKHKQFFLITKRPSDPNSLGDQSVLSLAGDSRGTIWIGTDDGGLNEFNQLTGLFRKYPIGRDHARGVSQNVVTDLEFTRQGELWVGTTGAGISILQPRTDKFRYIGPGLPENGGLSNEEIVGIFQDSRDRIWIGTNGGGLNMLDPGQTGSVQYLHNPAIAYSISNNYVTDIFEDSGHRIWVGTWDGLNLFDEESKVFRRIIHDPQDSTTLSNNEVTCIFEDSRNRLWIGTFTGLNLMNTETFTFRNFNQSNGFPSNVICAILEDNHERLWISTFMGITCFDPQLETCRNFDVADGLQGNQFHFRSAYHAPDDQLFFGGINGITRFQPDSIRQNEASPSIEFTGFKLFNKPAIPGGKDSPLKNSIWKTKEIRLKHNQSTFSFEFVAINYSASAKGNYRYKLKNYDPEWIDNKNNRTANYTKVPPGKYEFCVIASNNDQVWNSDGISMIVTITPPFWKTWWARAVLLMLVLCTILGAHYLRVRQIKRQKMKLEIQVESRTRELVKKKTELEKQAQLLAEANTEIRLKNNYLQEQKEEIERQSDEIRRINSILSLSNESLTINVKQISKDRVEEKIVSFDEFRGIYPDEEACYTLIRSLKARESVHCKKCGSTEFYPISTGRFLRRCKSCSYREPVTDHTIFFQIRFPIVKGFYILYLVSSGRNLTSDELSGQLDLRRETCWAFRNKVVLLMGKRKKSKNPIEGWKELILVPSAAVKRPNHVAEF